MSKVVRLNRETAALLELVRQRDNQLLSRRGMTQLRDMRSDSELIFEGLESVFAHREKQLKKGETK